LFGKKKKKEEETEEESSEDSGGSGGSGGDAEMSMGGMVAELTKIKATLESFKEIRKANSERFSTINEQIGEIRGQVMDVNRNMGVLEVKVSKAADLVESVHPDKLMIQVQKSDGKVEALRGLIESKDAMVQNIMEQLKSMRNQMKVFKGIEEVLKLNEDVKTEALNMKKLTAMVERHADRVENVFVESQKTFKEFNEVIGQMSVIKSEIKDIGEKADKLEVKSVKFIDKKEFEKRLSEIEKLGKRMKGLADEADKSLKTLHMGFGELKGELKGTFDERLERADTLSNAFARTLQENPMFAKGLDLGKFINMELTGGGTESDEGSQVNTEQAAEEGGDSGGDSGGGEAGAASGEAGGDAPAEEKKE
jgi:predicted  nucleic acid-binding Zn-ribbon protein